MKEDWIYSCRLGLTIALVMTLAIGCSKKPEAEKRGAAPKWRSHVPQNTDLLVVADLSALRSTAWYKDTQDPSEPRTLELKKQAGFSQDDVSLLIVCSDLDTFPPLEDLKTIASVSQTNALALQSTVMPHLNATVLIMLKKHISWQQARAAVNVLFADTADAKITDADNEDRVVVTQASSGVPLHVTLAEDGYLLKLTTYEPSGTDATPLTALFSTEESLQTNGPIRVSMQASEAMRIKIRESIEGTLASPSKDRTALMLASLMKSFVSFTSLAIAMNPGVDGTAVYGEFDLGTAENATSAEAVIQTVLIPLITLSMTQYTDKNSPAVLQDTKTSVRGTRVILRTKLNAQSMTLPLPSNNGQTRPTDASLR